MTSAPKQENIFFPVKVAEKEGGRTEARRRRRRWEEVSEEKEEEEEDRIVALK